jgi:lauroyl/myristoyl acyltransferase
MAMSAAGMGGGGRVERRADCYLNLVLEAAAWLPVATALRFTAATANRFLDRLSHASVLYPGVLEAAAANLDRAGIVAPEAVAAVIDGYLRFEARLVLEQIWLRRGDHRRLRAVFRPADVAALEARLRTGPAVIALPHTAFNSFIGLAAGFRPVTPVVIANPLAAAIARPTPAQRSVLRLYRRWLTRQDFIFVNDGDVLERGLACLRAGRPLIIAPDVPAAAEGAVAVTFLDQCFRVPAGAAVIARRAAVPLLAAVPWTDDLCAPYRLALEIIDPALDIPAAMAALFAVFDRYIRRAPACWQGWLYFGGRL